MKRLWKGALAAIGALVLVAGGLALYVQVAGIPRYSVEPVELRVEATPERALRGKKLATILCAGCHIDPAQGRLAGHPMVDVPSKFGVVYSSNITRDPVKGIGA